MGKIRLDNSFKTVILYYQRICRKIKKSVKNRSVEVIYTYLHYISKQLHISRYCTKSISNNTRTVVLYMTSE